MSIDLQDCPLGCRDIATHAYLRRRTSSAAEEPPDIDNLQVSRGTPTYHLTIEQAQRRPITQHLRTASRYWRYLVTDQQQTHWLELTAHTGQPTSESEPLDPQELATGWKFSSLSTGALVNSYTHALNTVQERFHLTPERHQITCVDIPEIHVRTIRLHSVKEDLFVVFSPLKGNSLNDLLLPETLDELHATIDDGLERFKPSKAKSRF